MAEGRNIIGLSPDFIIHPGETLSEVLEDRGMTQRDLAVRTGVTEKHVSTVINGKKNISAAYARKLEYALGIEAAFWMNLQAGYDREMLEFEEAHSIVEAEISVLEKLKDVVPVWARWGWLKADANPAGLVLELRKILRVSDLCSIPRISCVATYRRQGGNADFDPYVMFAWQRMCEILTQDLDIADSLDTARLQELLPEIKETMFSEARELQRRLASLFAECGIAFRIVPNFAGAPVQGFVKKTEAGAVILCLTLRQKFADVFWFTLFHEIAHILRGDTENEFVDFAYASSKAEKEADKMASGLLLEPKAYAEFVMAGGYKEAGGIAAFARDQKVKEYIVEGRLMKDGKLPWGERPKYKWAT